MPEICRFLGIVIYMYFDEHNPPHFHAKYNEYKASIEIDNLSILKGELPPRVLSLIAEWGMMYRNELFDNWNSLKNNGKFKKVKSLV